MLDLVDLHHRFQLMLMLTQLTGSHVNLSIFVVVNVQLPACPQDDDSEASFEFLLEDDQQKHNKLLFSSIVLPLHYPCVCVFQLS